MFEQRIVCHKLSNLFQSTTTHNNQEEWINKHNKGIQDFKRRMLNIELEQYEIEIQEYEHLYEQELTSNARLRTRLALSRRLNYYSLFCVFIIERNTIKTNCLFHEYSNNWYFKIFR
jgi:predicted Ser/Thr protein kinase